MKACGRVAPGQAVMLTRVVVDRASVAEFAAELRITASNAWVRLHRLASRFGNS